MMFVDRSKYAFLEKRIKKEGMKYDDDYVREYLYYLYGFRCCYCDSAVSYFEIDHFYPQKPSSTKKNNIDEIENWHLSCKRCNKYKSNYGKYSKMLSPDYYDDGLSPDWSLTNQKKLDECTKYEGPYFRCNDEYEEFFLTRLKFNGTKRLDRSLLLLRVLYLMDLMKIMKTCCDHMKQYKKRNTLLFVLFRPYKRLILEHKESSLNLMILIAGKFKKNACFSSMIVNTLGKAFIDMLKEFDDYERNRILKVFSD